MKFSRLNSSFRIVIALSSPGAFACARFHSVMALLLCSFPQVVGGKMTESGRLCAFITKVKRGSLADTVGHLRPGRFRPLDSHVASVSWSERMPGLAAPLA